MYVCVKYLCADYCCECDDFSWVRAGCSFLCVSKKPFAPLFRIHNISLFLSHFVIFSFYMYCECLLLFAVFRFLSNLSVFNLIFVFRMHFCLRICSLKIHLISKKLVLYFTDLRCWGLVFASRKIFQLISFDVPKGILRY